MDFNCDICKSQFSTKFTLTRHLNNKHGITNEVKQKSSKCISCPNLTFSKKVLLINHLNDNHGTSIEKEIINFSNVSGMYSDLFSKNMLLIILIIYNSLKSRI